MRSAGSRKTRRSRRVHSSYLHPEAAVLEQDRVAPAGLRGCRVISFVGATACLAALVFLFISDDLVVRSVEAAGNTRVTAEQVAHVASVEGQKSLVVDCPAVERRLERLPYVRESQVWVVLPGTVRVQIDERVPYLGFHSGGEYILVDREGVVLERSASAEGTLQISLLDEGHLESGGRVPVELVEALGGLTGELVDKSGLGVSRIEYSPIQGIRVVVESGQTIAFGGPESLDRKLDIVQAFLAGDREWSSLDVSSTERPFYRTGDR